MLQVPQPLLPPGVLPDPTADAPGEADTVAAPAAAAAVPTTLTFDLASDPGALGLYWGKMQHVVAHNATSRGVSTTKRPLGRCFPFDRAPEVGVAAVDRCTLCLASAAPRPLEAPHVWCLAEESLRACLVSAPACAVPRRQPELPCQT